MSRLALALGALAAAGTLLAPLTARAGVLRPLAAFKLWLAAALPGIAAIGAALLALVAGAERGPAAAALLLGTLPVLVLMRLVQRGRSVPRLNDVTTDPDDPPAFVEARNQAANRGRDFAYPERFKARVRAAYPDLKPLVADVPAAILFERALGAARAAGWEVTAQDAANGRIEAVATSALWRFRDDVAIRVRPEGTRARLDVRSKSRDGKGDFGANAARIRALLASVRAGISAAA